MAMPTTSGYYPWGTLPVPQTCFQIYGTKRKATLSDSCTANEPVMPAVKRHCLRLPAHHRQPSSGQSHSPQSHHPCHSKAPATQTDGGAVDDQTHQSAFPEPTSMHVGVTNCAHAASTQQVFEDAAVHSLNLPHMNTCPAANLTSNNDEPAVDQSGSWQGSGGPHRLLEQRGENRLDVFEEEVEFESNDYWDVPYDHHLLKMVDEIERARIAMETQYAPTPDQLQSRSAPSGASLTSGSVNVTTK